MMPINELKFCPFCGGEVIPPDWEDGDTCYYIEHKKDCFLLYNGMKVISVFEIEAWNRRAERTTPLSSDSCVHCGKPIRGGFFPSGNRFGDKFCRECGAKVVDDAD